MFFEREIKWLVGLSLLLLSGTALADINPTNGNNAWTIYAFANANVLAGMLEAAKGLMGESSFTTLLVFVGAMSVLIASTMSINGKVDPKVVALILGVGITANVGLKEKSNVIVTDPVFGDSIVVQDVPSIVALPASMITTMGHNFTQLLEKHFTTPSGLTLSNGGGFNLSNTLIRASTGVEVTSPYLKATINRFMEDCVVPSIAAGRINSDEILTSKDLWSQGSGTFNDVFISLFTVVYTGNTPSGLVMPCKAAGVPQGFTGETATSARYPSVSSKGAFEYISKYFATAATDWFKSQVNTTAQGTWLVNTLNAAQKFVFDNSSYNTTKSLEQAAAINAIRPSLMAMSSQTGSSSSSMGYAVAVAEQSQKSSWGTTAVLFQDLAAYTFSVLQAFIIGLAPLMLVIMMLPGGLKVAKNYGMILVWLALWEPTLAIINYVIMLYSQGNLAGVASAGYDMMSVAFVDSRTNNFILAASALAAATPMISWAIIKGGNAFTSFIASGIGTQFANKAGETAVTGNKDYGNVKAHNDMENKTDTVAQSHVGYTPAVANYSGGAGSESTHLGGHSAFVAGQSLTQQFSATKDQTLATAHNVVASAQSARAKALKAATAASTNAVQQFRQSLSKGKGHSSNTQHGKDHSTGIESSHGHDIRDVLSKAKSMLQQVDGGISGSIGLTTFGSGANAKLGVIWTDKRGNEHKVELGDLENWVQKASGGERAQRAEVASKVFSAMSEATKGIDKNVSKSFEEAATHNETISKTWQIEQKAAESMKEAQSISLNAFTSDSEVRNAMDQMNDIKDRMQARWSQLSGLESNVKNIKSQTQQGLQDTAEQVGSGPNPDQAPQQIQQQTAEVLPGATQAAEEAKKDTNGLPTTIEQKNEQTDQKAQETEIKATQQTANTVGHQTKERQKQESDYQSERDSSYLAKVGDGAEVFVDHVRSGARAAQGVTQGASGAVSNIAKTAMSSLPSSGSLDPRDNMESPSREPLGGIGTQMQKVLKDSNNVGALAKQYLDTGVATDAKQAQQMAENYYHRGDASSQPTGDKQKVDENMINQLSQITGQSQAQPQQSWNISRDEKK